MSRVEGDAYDLYRSAQRLLEEREAPAAVPLLERASRQLPDERAILRLLAVAYYYSGSFIPAEPLMRRLVDADPLDADVHHMLAKTLELTGRPEQARQYYALAGQLTSAYAVNCQVWGGKRTPADPTCASVPMPSVAGQGCCVQRFGQHYPPLRCLPDSADLDPSGVETPRNGCRRIGSR